MNTHSSDQKRFNLATSVVSMAVLALINSAHAQDTKPATAKSNELEAVVVTGLRASLESALRAKRDDNGIVDVIKSEDMGKFPDTNLAESLQRIPGVVIDRDAGEGRSITVRGLGADFTKVRINGIEAQATTGGSDNSGGTNRGRGFDFNVFASELFQSVTVRKSASADVDEGSLGTTVDLQTTRPFDLKGFQAVVSAKASYNDLSGKTVPRTAFLLSNTFADRKVGVLFSGAYSKRSLLEEGFSSGGWQNGTSNNGWCPPQGAKIAPGTTLPAGSTATTCGPAAQGALRLPNTPENIAAYNTASDPNTWTPRLPRFGRMTHEQDRLGLTGSIQLRPAEGTLLTLDMLYSKLSATRQEDYLMALGFSRALTSGGRPQTGVLSTAYDSNGALLFGKYTNVDIRAESRLDELSTTFTQPTVTLEQDIGDALKLTFRGGRAESKFRNPIQTTTTFDAVNVQGYEIDFRGDKTSPAISYPFDVTKVGNPMTLVSIPAGATSLANTQPSEIRMRPQGTDNKTDLLHLNLAWELMPDKLTLKAGGDYKKYSFDSFESRRTSDFIFAPPAGTSIESLSSLLTGYGKGQSLPPGSVTSWAKPNFDAITTAYDIYCNCLKSGPVGGPGDFTLTSITNGNARGANRSISETDKSIFLMADFNTSLAGLKLRGNFGARYVTTDMLATGYQAKGGGTQVQVENSYTDFLPALNVSAQVARDVVLRFAAAKVMARPTLPSLTPGGSLGTTGTLTISSGNPLLEPFRATTMDANAEWYFDKNAFLGLGLFQKNISSYIQSLQKSMPFNQTGLPLSLLPPNFTGDEVFMVTSPVNTEGGKLQGLELNYQQPFSFLPTWGKNFGTMLNFTLVEAKINYYGSATALTTITDDLINMSPRSWNAALYYDDGRFSVRVSAANRSDYITRVPGGNGNDVEGKKATTNIDFSASYKLNDNFEVTFEGINLTNQANLQFISRARESVGANQVTGREFLVGARYKF
jgi:iron complex outermembrane receptor protein